jgi:hypothetical protein
MLDVKHKPKKEEGLLVMNSLYSRMPEVQKASSRGRFLSFLVEGCYADLFTLLLFL